MVSNVTTRHDVGALKTIMTCTHQQHKPASVAPRPITGRDGNQPGRCALSRRPPSVPPGIEVAGRRPPATTSPRSAVANARIAFRDVAPTADRRPETCGPNRGDFRPRRATCPTRERIGQGELGLRDRWARYQIPDIDPFASTMRIEVSVFLEPGVRGLAA